MNTTEKEVIEITERAARQIRKLMSEGENQDKPYLRVGVKGGGCSGLSYIIDFDEAGEMDTISTIHDIPVVVDKRQALYLYGTVLDFKDGLDSRGFIFENPQASSTCGCGSSFSA
ncbi:MAG: iron-sulfur cluster assembly accessory protein [Candidatus Cyclonatronum sp.]|uniref:HesB/IscA family protein n=1 Tax=Cyclonatronum sp. TaxID=3024185 RepID=UPI0025B9FA73|nr:iron-sulfur cluster assembly accessory protein [Cyclonatronum sp.]MCC5932954.1 iron-sulfur cluster assembly accessory protein [Balneolales bacterium]MCH8485329.1 iron-sulfur cluster assembly accessory protein [Cyclonatronum sp.]